MIHFSRTKNPDQYAACIPLGFRRAVYDNVLKLGPFTFRWRSRGEMFLESLGEPNDR